MWSRNSWILYQKDVFIVSFLKNGKNAIDLIGIRKWTTNLIPRRNTIYSRSEQKKLFGMKKLKDLWSKITPTKLVLYHTNNIGNFSAFIQWSLRIVCSYPICEPLVLIKFPNYLERIRYKIKVVKNLFRSCT